MNRDKLYLAHILECIEKIERFTLDGKEAFVKDEKTQDAVLRNLHTLAESSTRISKPLIEKNSHIPWREMSGFRNVVVHDYLGLDLDQVWDIIVLDLPSLKHNIHTILEEL